MLSQVDEFNPDIPKPWGGISRRLGDSRFSYSVPNVGHCRTSL